MFQKYATALAVLATLATAASCSDDKTDNAPATATPVSLAATLDGSQHNPMVTSPASGTMTGSYNPSTRVLTYTVIYKDFAAGVVPTAGHIHVGAPGVNGAVVVPFSSVTTSPITGTATLTQADGDKLISNSMYVNIHTAANPNGEIRGNIKAADQNIVRLAATIDSYSQVPTNSSTATGTMTGTYNKSTRQLNYFVSYQGFAAGAGPIQGHIHQAVPGVNGPVAVPFDALASPIAGSAVITQADADKLLANAMYVNLHTTKFPNGEIRGDIRVQP